MDCRWRIRTTPGNAITIIFNDFKFQKKYNNPYCEDYVTVSRSNYTNWNIYGLSSLITFGFHNFDYTGVPSTSFESYNFYLMKFLALRLSP